VAKVKVIPAMPGRAPIIKTEPESGFIQVTNRATTVNQSADPPAKSLRFSRESNGEYNRIAVSGVISAKANAYETLISLQNPRGYVLTLFAEKLSEQFPESNICVAGLANVPDDAQFLGYTARSIAEVIRRLNKESDNLNAEMLLYALGYQKSEKTTSTEKGIEIVQQMMTQLGFQTTSYKMVDGSGLSNQNYLTPEQLVAVLSYMHQSQHFDLFRQSLPIAGVDGTLAHRMKSSAAFRKVAAKTGSLTGVSALSGYATARNGNLLAFSIMIQNFTERTSFVAVNYIDRICTALTE
jgi:D-alanyl-D-alanine carboxypeptidase/D-alanyl-D-alanine-endopeptidase (penicillin-binding protein 4)